MSSRLQCYITSASQRLLASRCITNSSIKCFSTAPTGVTVPSAEEIEKGLKGNEKYINYVRTINSVSPMSLVTNSFPASIEAAPSRGQDIQKLSGMPDEVLKQQVIIEPRPRRSTQQGSSYAHQWQIVWPVGERWKNPLMGWTSTADPMSNMRMFFDSREDAVAYADRNGWNYKLKRELSTVNYEPGHHVYDDNFLSKPVKNQLKIEGSKNKIFNNSNYGKSNWFMPLKYHGDGPVEQHGPPNK